jgi:hypothetical protein
LKKIKKGGKNRPAYEQQYRPRHASCRKMKKKEKIEKKDLLTNSSTDPGIHLENAG